MESMKVNLEEEKQSTPQSSRSDYSNASSGFSFEADSLPIDLNRSFHRDLYELQLDQIIKKHNQKEDMLMNYNNCFIRLENKLSELSLLRDENLKLRADNLDLSILLSAKESEIESSLSSLNMPSVSAMNSASLSGLNIPSVYGLNSASDSGQIGLIGLRNDSELKQLVAGKQKDERSERVLGDSVEEGRAAMGRGALPKVISVRSSGFMSTNKNQSVAGSSSSKGIVGGTGSKLSIPLRLAAKVPQSGEEVELEVYNQGTAKTELCNKWEETGTCPYGDRCQFAHGIKELRPVIRHPRYKTELCRMINSGGTCPYGHRCHFRHSFDPSEEKEVVL